jgi:hypothetical protein
MRKDAAMEVPLLVVVTGMPSSRKTVVAATGSKPVLEHHRG